MSTSPLSRIAGPLAVVTGVLVVATRLPTIILILTGGGDLTAYVLGPVHAITSVVSIVAFGLLVLTLVGIYERETPSAGWFGLLGFAAALMGTIFMTGDWWYEAFAVPRIAEVVPETIPTFVGGRLLMGGLASFTLLGIGWVLFGAASLRARVFPTTASAAIVVGGLLSGAPIGLAYLTGGVILGLAIGWLGVWLMRATSDVSDQARIVSAASPVRSAASARLASADSRAQTRTSGATAIGSRITSPPSCGHSNAPTPLRKWRRGTNVVRGRPKLVTLERGRSIGRGGSPGSWVLAWTGTNDGGHDDSWVRDYASASRRNSSIAA